MVVHVEILLDRTCAVRRSGWNRYVARMNLQDIQNQIKESVQVESTQIVILKATKEIGPDRNLLAFDMSTGKYLWRLAPPVMSEDGYDGFVNFMQKETDIWVGTWSGYALRIDPHTGQILEQKFTKWAT